MVDQNWSVWKNYRQCLQIENLPNPAALHERIRERKFPSHQSLIVAKTYDHVPKIMMQNNPKSCKKIEKKRAH